MVCELISSFSQLLLKIIISTLVIPFLILHDNYVNKVFICLIVFLDTKTHGLLKKSISNRPIEEDKITLNNDFMAAIWNFEW